MRGWKTWVGVGLMIASVVLKALGYDDIAGAILPVGGSAAAIGIGSKIEKQRKFFLDSYKSK